jgi:hypothetical protein
MLTVAGLNLPQRGRAIVQWATCLLFVVCSVDLGTHILLSSIIILTNLVYLLFHIVIETKTDIALCNCKAYLVSLCYYSALCYKQNLTCNLLSYWFDFKIWIILVTQSYSRKKCNKSLIIRLYDSKQKLISTYYLWYKQVLRLSFYLIIYMKIHIMLWSYITLYLMHFKSS